MDQPKPQACAWFNWLGLVIIFAGAFGQYLWWDLKEPLLTQRHIVCGGTIVFGVLLTFLPRQQNWLMIGWIVFLGIATSLEVLWTRFRWQHAVFYLLLILGLLYYYEIQKDSASKNARDEAKEETPEN